MNCLDTPGFHSSYQPVPGAECTSCSDPTESTHPFRLLFPVLLPIPGPQHTILWKDKTKQWESSVASGSGNLMWCILPSLRLAGGQSLQPDNPLWMLSQLERWTYNMEFGLLIHLHFLLLLPSPPSKIVNKTILSKSVKCKWLKPHG